MRFVVTLSIATLYIQARILPDTLLESDQKSDITELDSQQVKTDQESIRTIRQAVTTAITLIPEVGAFFGKLLCPLLGSLASRENSDYHNQVINKFVPRALTPQRHFVNHEKYSELIAKTQNGDFKGVLEQICSLQKAEVLTDHADFANQHTATRVIIQQIDCLLQKRLATVTHLTNTFLSVLIQSQKRADPERSLQPHR